MKRRSEKRKKRRNEKRKKKRKKKGGLGDHAFFWAAPRWLSLSVVDICKKFVGNEKKTKKKLALGPRDVD